MIVFLAEEASMTAALKQVVPRVWPSGTEGVNWLALHFQGKQDLEKNIRQKMQEWNYGDPHFIILRDQDGGDCQKLKQELLAKCEEGGKPHHVRVVCQELENWLLGDLEAVEAAFPQSKAGKFIDKVKFRNPDKLTNASDELEHLVDFKGKIVRAQSIAGHLNIERCRSHSFGVFISKVKELMSDHS